MRRIIVMTFLAIGAVAGFTAGARGLAHHKHGHRGFHPEFEAHVADVCLQAARRAALQEGAPKPSR